MGTDDVRAEEGDARRARGAGRAPTARRVALALAPWALFVVLFLPFARAGGSDAHALVLVPVAVTAALLGMRIGLLSGLLGAPLALVLADLAGADRAGLGQIGPANLAILGAAIGWMRDLGERSRLEVAERRVADEERRLRETTERLRALDARRARFVSEASHELRSPVTNLRLYIDMLQSGDPEKRAQYLEVIEDQSDRLMRLVGDVLSLSRLEAVEVPAVFAEVDLNDLVGREVRAHRLAAAAAGLTLEFAPDPSLPTLRAAREPMAQLVANLVANALTYTLQGGVSVSTAAGVGWAELRVRDTGIGIGPDDLPRVFERFFRGREAEARSARGTGLGLAIVREIVEMHAGEVDVESVSGRGTTVTVRLPRPASTPSDAPEAPRPADL